MPRTSIEDGLNFDLSTLSFVMKQIFVISAFFIVLILAIFGTMTIFDVMTFEATKSVALKSTAAIVLLAVCAAAIKLLLSGRKGQPD